MATNDPRGAPPESALPSVDLEALEKLLDDEWKAVRVRSVPLFDGLMSAIAELRARRSAPTGQLQEATWAVGQLRHLYKQMVGGSVYDTAEAARGLLGPAIEKLEPFTTPAAAPPSAPQGGLFKERVLAICEEKLREYLAVREPAGVRAIENVKVAIRAAFLPEKPAAPPPSADAEKPAGETMQKALSEGRGLAAFDKAIGFAPVPPARPPGPSVDAAPIEAGGGIPVWWPGLSAPPIPPAVMREVAQSMATLRELATAVPVPAVALKRLSDAELLGDPAQTVSWPARPMPIPPAVTEKEVVPSAGDRLVEATGQSATPGVVLKEGTAPARRWVCTKCGWRGTEPRIERYGECCPRCPYMVLAVTPIAAPLPEEPRSQSPAAPSETLNEKENEK